MNTSKFGDKGEEMAVKFLLEKGYAILETNWRFSHKEIDIIAKFNNELIIVEVKTRSSNFFELPEHAVDLRKQKYIIETTQKYIEQSNIDLEVRFDIIAITQKNKQFYIKHIENAFAPNF